jgi:ferric-dicitrate binding protein FerR (iron transport regulator)
MLTRPSLLLLALPLIAAAPASFEHWSATALQAYDQKLAAKPQPATEELGSYPMHSAVMRRRVTSSESELHQHAADWVVVENGSATLLLGGKIPNGKTTAPGELRGVTIEGGTRQRLTPGDIVHVPAGTPHQFLLEKGETITYFALKVQGQ